MLAAMFVGEHLLANRRLQTLLLLWLDVRSLENIWYKSMMTASDMTIKESSHTRLSHLISSECTRLNWTRCRFRWDEMIWDECCCGDSLVHWPLTSTIQVQVCYETLSVMSHLATLSRNSDAQPCRWSDTDKLTRCTLFRIRVAQLGDAPWRVTPTNLTQESKLCDKVTRRDITLNLYGAVILGMWSRAQCLSIDSSMCPDALR